MANRYGEAALMAVKMETYGKAITPLERWDDAVRKLYPTTIAGQKKGGPRGAFLGLCEAGLVKGIPAAPSGSHNRNRVYAVKDGEEVPHASQMDVVMALWKNGLIAPDAQPVA